jgi:hypothetical protein
MTNENKSLSFSSKINNVKMLSTNIVLWYFSDKIYKIACISLVAFTRHVFKTSTSYCHRSVPEHVARDAFTCNKLQTRPLRDKSATCAALLCRIKSYEKKRRCKESMLKYRFNIWTVSLEKLFDETLGTPAYHTRRAFRRGVSINFLGRGEFTISRIGRHVFHAHRDTWPSSAVTATEGHGQAEWR